MMVITMASYALQTPPQVGGPGGRDRRLAAKRRKNARKSAFFVKNKDSTIYKGEISL